MPLCVPHATLGGTDNVAHTSFLSTWWINPRGFEHDLLSLQCHKATYAWPVTKLALAEMRNVRKGNGDVYGMQPFRVICRVAPHYIAVATSSDWEEIQRDFHVLTNDIVPRVIAKLPDDASPAMKAKALVTHISSMVVNDAMAALSSSEMAAIAKQVHDLGTLSVDKLIEFRSEQLQLAWIGEPTPVFPALFALVADAHIRRSQLENDMQYGALSDELSSRPSSSEKIEAPTSCEQAEQVNLEMIEGPTSSQQADQVNLYDICTRISMMTDDAELQSIIEAAQARLTVIRPAAVGAAPTKAQAPTADAASAAMPPPPPPPPPPAVPSAAAAPIKRGARQERPAPGPRAADPTDELMRLLKEKLASRREAVQKGDAVKDGEVHDWDGNP